MTDDKEERYIKMNWKSWNVLGLLLHGQKIEIPKWSEMPLVPKPQKHTDEESWVWARTGKVEVLNPLEWKLAAAAKMAENYATIMRYELRIKELESQLKESRK